jgi:LuxR family maltose regulon positive regulatory protein
VLVSAPAGFGKTTLITDWLARTENDQVVWLSLDEYDNDLAHFLNLLITALQQVDDRIGQVVLQTLNLPQPFQILDLVTVLINDIAACIDELTLIFDDLHLLTAPAVHEVLALLLEHLPQTVRVVVITREDPPLPLARLRTRHQLLEIREGDLRFTLTETTAFFQNTISLDLSAEALQILSTQTEGWVAGIQLAALALQDGRIDPDTFLATFSGSDRFVADYLLNEVLAQLPPKTQKFLKQTSILDRLSAPLCEAMTGQSDSQAVLEQLEAENLFLIPLDHQRQWFRYYRLFGEFLRGRLTLDERRKLHTSALLWFDANGYLRQALHHALQAGDYDTAERLILQTADEVMVSGSMTTLVHWLDALPPDRLQASIPLVVYRGLVAILTGQIATAQCYSQLALQKLENGVISAETQGQLALLQAFLALAQRDDTVGIAFANAALQSLENPASRIMTLWLIAEAHERMGNIRASIPILTEAQQIARTQPPRIFGVSIDAFLASALNEYGQLQEAIALCQAATAYYVGAGGGALPFAALVYGRLAMLLFEANRLEEAAQSFTKFEQLTARFVTKELGGLRQGMRARLLAATGKSGQALAIWQTLRNQPAQEVLSDRSWLLADEMNLRLCLGHLSGVRHWVEQGNWALDDLSYLRFEEYLAYAHYLVLTDSITEASQLLTHLQGYAEANALHRKHMAVLILQAIAAERRGKVKCARERIIQAVEAAAPQGYVRVFLDYGEPMSRLLQRIRDVHSTFVDVILNAVQKPKAPLVDPLTERELEVLRLAADGLTNSEIADRLVIALGTVKQHINHIYSKLDVRTRTQAIIKGRELNLLTPDI